MFWIHSFAEEPNIKPSYEIKNFTHHSGIYFEKLGELHQVESLWKLVIKIDITSLTERLTQLAFYVQKQKNYADY